MKASSKPARPAQPPRNGNHRARAGVAHADAAKRLGATSSWCPEAIVYETVPKDRIGVGYQFRRARDQAATSFWRKAAKERRSLPVNIATAFGKTVLGGFLFLISPLTMGRTLVDGTRLVGYGLGYTLAMAGRRSRHYEVLQGE